jgi:hypothetical protein
MKTTSIIFLPPLFPEEMIPSLQHLFDRPDSEIEKIQFSSFDENHLEEQLSESLSIYQNNRLFQKEILNLLLQSAELWKNPLSAYRILAEKWLPLTTGFSQEMISRCLDITFNEFTLKKLEQCYQSNKSPVTNAKYHLHIHAGNVFTSGLFGIIYGLLSQKPQLVKPSSTEPLFPWLFIHSLLSLNPAMAAHISCCNWQGGTKSIEGKVFTYTDKIFAYGDDETIEDLRKRVPEGIIFHGYGHKFSFGIIRKADSLKDQFTLIAEKIAEDVILYEQQGCMSPHFILVETGNKENLFRLGFNLAESLHRMSKRIPPGNKTLEEKILIKSIRDDLLFQSSLNQDTKLFSSENSLDWTVACLQQPQIPISCLNRFIYLVSIPDIPSIIPMMKPFIGKIQTVGYWGIPGEKDTIEHLFDLFRANRFCILGEMQKPIIEEVHPGKPNSVDFY